MKRDKFVIPGWIGIWRIRQKEGPSPIWLVHRIDLQRSRFFSSMEEMITWTTYPETAIMTSEVEEWIAQLGEPAPTPPDEFHHQIQLQQDPLEIKHSP